MRTLKFIVEGLTIRKDPSCDFSGLVPGTKGYLQAMFTFDADWNGCKKMAVFSRSGNVQIPVRIDNNICTIPDDILARRNFEIKVIGVKPEFRLPTNSLEVNQDG